MAALTLATPVFAQDPSAEAEPNVPQEEQLLQEALAGGEDDSTDQATAPAPDIGYTATVMLFGAGVLALAGWGVRRFHLGKQKTVASDIDVVDTVTLDGGDKISLVEVDGRRVLVGRSSGHMRSLDSWPVRQTDAIGADSQASAEPDAARAEAVDSFFDNAPSAFSGEFEGTLERARRSEPAPSPDTFAGRDGTRERDSVMVSLRALEQKHGGRS
jgi:flagellar biogenesis protein FliO